MHGEAGKKEVGHASETINRESPQKTVVKQEWFLTWLRPDEAKSESGSNTVIFIIGRTKSDALTCACSHARARAAREPAHPRRTLARKQ